MEIPKSSTVDLEHYKLKRRKIYFSMCLLSMLLISSVIILIFGDERLNYFSISIISSISTNLMSNVSNILFTLNNNGNGNIQTPKKSFSFSPCIRQNTEAPLSQSSAAFTPINRPPISLTNSSLQEHNKIIASSPRNAE